MGAGDGTRTRDIQLGRKDANAQAVRVFRKALDASMAHSWSLFSSLSALLEVRFTAHRISLLDGPRRHPAAHAARPLFVRARAPFDVIAAKATSPAPKSRSIPPIQRGGAYTRPSDVLRRRRVR